jgi:hypothetical protein
LFIGDDCIAMPLKNCPDVDTITCVLMLCGALTDLTIDTVLTFYIGDDCIAMTALNSEF